MEIGLYSYEDKVYLILITAIAINVNSYRIETVRIMVKYDRFLIGIVEVFPAAPVFRLFFCGMQCSCYRALTLPQYLPCL